MNFCDHQYSIILVVCFMHNYTHPEVCPEESWREPLASWMSTLVTERTNYPSRNFVIPMGRTPGFLCNVQSSGMQQVRRTHLDWRVLCTTSGQDEQESGRGRMKRTEPSLSTSGGNVASTVGLWLYVTLGEDTSSCVLGCLVEDSSSHESLESIPSAWLPASF